MIPMIPSILALLLLQAPTAPDPTLICVEGRVVNASTNQPIERARVVLLRTDTRAGYGSGIWDTPAGTGADDPAANQMAVNTDVNGIFRFRLKGPAKFRFFTSAPGFVHLGMQLDDASQYERTPSGKNERIELRLSPESFIAGRVLDSETGKPVPGVAVQPYRESRRDGGINVVRAGASATTGPDGRYELKGLMPGSYFLEVRPLYGRKFAEPRPVEDFKREVRMGYGRYWLPGVDSHAQSSPVILQNGGSSGDHDFRIKRTRIAAIRAKVIAPGIDGKMSVSLQEVEESLNVASYSFAASGEWEADKEFELDGLTPGTYCLVAQPAGAIGLLKIRVDGSNIDGLEVTVRKPAQVTGRVILRGREPKPGEDLLPDTELTVALMPVGRMSFGEQSAKVSPVDGAFHFNDHIHDRYRVYAMGAPQGYKLAEVRLNGTAMPHGLLTLDPAAPKLELELELAPAAASATAKIVDGLSPANAATVILAREPIVEEMFMGNISRVKTDEKGVATFANLIPGTYRLLAYRKDALWIDDRQLIERTRGGKEVKVADGGAIQVEADAVNY